MSKSIAILGASGSIGQSTLRVIATYPERFHVEVMTGGKNWQRMAQDIQKFKPRYVAMACSEALGFLQEACADSRTEFIGYGANAVAEAASLKVDLTIAAITGIAGLIPTVRALEAGNQVALANKEALVCAGKIMLKAVCEGKPILPLDSEHSAIFQCLAGEQRSCVEKITLTASGGPFRTWPQEKINKAGIKEALAHPNWSMGAKLTIDSASMMNKGLEYIEALHLFQLEPSKLDVLIHPQSIVHSFVSFHDGAVIAQLGHPDMAAPISYAMSYPRRISLPFVERLDWTKLAALTFEVPSYEKFPLLKLAMDVATLPSQFAIVMNAANEVAVAAFLEGKISFGRIVSVISDAIEICCDTSPQSLEDVLMIDNEARARINL